MQIVKTAPLVIAESPKHLYLPLVVDGKGDNSEKPRAQINQSFSKVKIGSYRKCAHLGTKRKEDTMDKITYTIVEKKGETFDTFRFGGFNLSLGKTLAQSFVDACATDKALAGGFYVTCAALVDIARKCGFLLSSAVIDCVTNPAITAAFDAVCAAGDKVATIKRQLTRAKHDAERLAYIPVTGLGGTADERKAREKSLMAALVDTREYINTLSDNLTMAQEEHKRALVKLTTAERAYYEENAKKNAKKNGADNGADNNNNNTNN